MLLFTKSRMLIIQIRKNFRFQLNIRFMKFITHKTLGNIFEVLKLFLFCCERSFAKIEGVR